MLKVNIKQQMAWLCITFICFAVSAKTTPASNNTEHQYNTHRITPHSLSVVTNNGEITFSVLHRNAINVVYRSHAETFPATHLPSFANREGLQPLPIQVTQSQSSLTIHAGELTAIVTKHPFSVRYFHSDKLLLSEASGFFEGQTIEDNTTYLTQGVRFKLADNEQLIGGGERVIGMNRRGLRLPLYNRAHYGYETHSTQMGFSIPAVMSSNKYLLLFDNSAKGWLDIGHTQSDLLAFEAVAGRIAYTLFSGNSYTDILTNYVGVTGTQPMPPRWALGNFASRFGYRSQEEVLETVGLFKQFDIPLDAVVMDLYWFGKDIKGHMGNLDWDTSTFPNPQQMLNTLHQQGVKPILITEPFVLSTSDRWNDATNRHALAKNAQGTPKTFDFYFGNTGIVDVFNSNGTRWFNEIYTQLHAQGIKGWWGDLGEPEVHPADTLHQFDDGTQVNANAIHNVYGHQWAKILQQNLRKLSPRERPFILMRSGFSGSQRFGMIPWTGDVNRSWAGLKPQVELSLQMGMFGLGYTHSDLGGFAGGDSFDKALYIRWLQYGVFQPIYRPHGQDHIASEPVFHDQETRDILRKYIKLRYRLLPYHYTMAFQNSTTGIPLMRPTFLESTLHNEQGFDNAKSYFWGDAFFVQPIVSPNQSKVDVELPAGVWFNFFTEQRYAGNQVVNMPVDLNTIPVFVRAGAFIPMVEPVQSTARYSSEQLTLHYYADHTVPSAQGMMYEDDGKTFAAFEQKHYEQLHFSAEQGQDGLTISLQRNGESYLGMPNTRVISLQVHNLLSAPTAVTQNGKSTNFQWDPTRQQLIVELTWHHKPMNIHITH